MSEIESAAPGAECLRLETITLSKHRRTWEITMSRPAQRNSITATMMREMMGAVDVAERDADCVAIVLQGEGGVFCTGMDFKEAVRADRSRGLGPESGPNAEFFALLKRFTSTSKVVLAKVDGPVLAGGVGLAAASDLVLATPATQFSLTEAMWGFLPACVAPFVIRRVGIQRAYRMALTTEPVHASEALQIGLVDRITTDPDHAVGQYLLRLERIKAETVYSIKSYFRDLWIVDEAMERRAVQEANRWASDHRVRMNIHNFLEHQKFPWEDV